MTACSVGCVLAQWRSGDTPEAEQYELAPVRECECTHCIRVTRFAACACVARARGVASTAACFSAPCSACAVANVALTPFPLPRRDADRCGPKDVLRDSYCVLDGARGTSPHTYALRLYASSARRGRRKYSTKCAYKTDLYRRSFVLLTLGAHCTRRPCTWLRILVV